jgi:hypothetical protein
MRSRRAPRQLPTQVVLSDSGRAVLRGLLPRGTDKRVVTANALRAARESESSQLGPDNGHPMGRWCEHDILSGSDGSLRLALALCDAAGNCFETWPQEVQQYCGSGPPDWSNDGPGTVLEMTAQDVNGQQIVLVCAGGPDTHAKVAEVIDRTTAAMWTGRFFQVMQFINTLTERDVAQGECAKGVWDIVPEGDSPFTGRGYRVLALLFMRAGAAFPNELKAAFIGEMEYIVNHIDQDEGGNTGYRFVHERLLEELKRYDNSGGTSVKLSFQFPQEILKRGARFPGKASRYSHLSNRDYASFTVWYEKFLSRTTLPQAERQMLWSSPKMWTLNAVTQNTLSTVEVRKPIIFSPHNLSLLKNSPRPH